MLPRRFMKNFRSKPPDSDSDSRAVQVRASAETGFVLSMRGTVGSGTQWALPQALAHAWPLPLQPPCHAQQPAHALAAVHTDAG